VAREDAAAEVDEGGRGNASSNLAGVSIGGPRWTRSRKAAILGSRVETTKALSAAIASAQSPPSVFVTASGIDYYGASGDLTVDEESPPFDYVMIEGKFPWEQHIRSGLDRVGWARPPAASDVRGATARR
jgi:NAD dependent epimerase/dehydratase family enzyme